MSRPTRSGRDATGSVMDSTTEANPAGDPPIPDALLSLVRPKRTGRNENPAGAGTSVPGNGTGDGSPWDKLKGFPGVIGIPEKDWNSQGSTPWKKYALIAVVAWLAWHFMGKVKI